MQHRYRPDQPVERATFWTVQHAAALDQLRRTGHLRADGRRVEPTFRPAYRWLIGEIANRIGPPPPGVRYPIWVWTKRTDLRRVALLPTGTAGVLLQLEVPTERVVFTDFLRWHAVLDNQHLSRNEDEWESAKNADAANIQASWSRVFDLNDQRDLSWEGLPVAQGCLWEVREVDVRRVTKFVAR